MEHHRGHCSRKLLPAGRLIAHVQDIGRARSVPELSVAIERQGVVIVSGIGNVASVNHPVEIPPHISRLVSRLGALGNNQHLAGAVGEGISSNGKRIRPVDGHPFQAGTAVKGAVSYGGYRAWDIDIHQGSTATESFFPDFGNAAA